MSTEKTPAPAQESSRIEASEFGGMSMAAPAFSLSASSAPAAQLVAELTPEQVTAAIAFNNALGLDALHIRSLQHGIGATGSGVFDQATVTRINALSEQSLGQLNAAAFDVVFTRMVAANQHRLLIPLAAKFLRLATTDFVTLNHQTPATFTWRVAVPFSNLSLDNTTQPQTLTDAPNRLKNVTLGPTAFTGVNAFSTALTAINAVQYQTTPQQGAPTTVPATDAATTTPQLTATQQTAAISHNNFILSEALPRRVFLAAIGAAGSSADGTFNAAAVQAVANYQHTNNIARTDGRIDHDTLDHVIRAMVTAGQRDAVLRLAADFFNIDQLRVSVLMRHDSAQGQNANRDTSATGIESYTFGDAAFSTGLDGLGTALDQAVGAGTSMNNEALGVMLAGTNAARQTAMWSNPDAANEDGLVPWIRDNFPTEATLAAFLARQDLTQQQKLAAFGLFSVELGKLEFLMGVIFHGGTGQSWENLAPAGNNRGTFVNHFKGAVGNAPNAQPWCTMFAGYLRTLLGFRDDLAGGGPLIFNAGIRLDYWGTNNQNYISGQDDFTSPNDFQNYSGTNIDTPAWRQLRTNVNNAANAQARQTAVDNFFQNNPLPQPGDIMVINTGSTTNAYGGQQSNSSHTVNVERYANRTISTIEGNRGDRVTGVDLDLTDPADVGQVILLLRPGIELYTENQAAPAPQNGQQAPPAPSQEDILRPLRQMVRNLQLIADHRNYIQNNTAGATVSEMTGGGPGNGTN